MTERKKRKAPKHRTAPIVVGILAFAAVLVVLTVPPWVLPPIQSTETGPPAIEMVQFKDEDRAPDYLLPEPLPPAEPYEGEPKASEIYENVEVLGDLSEGEFTRLMLAITEWVAPEQGCEYCHNVEEGFASDDVYTKVVARQMLRMTRYVNTNWPEHVAPAGVTCYTCHRGENVPAETWYDQEEPSGDQFLGKPRPWYLEARTIRQFFPNVPYVKYLKADHATANIQSRDPLVAPDGTAEVAREQTAEDLYLFMMQQSNALGVNCTYCHNSRAFWDWSQSTPFRWIGYWGIRMVRDINSDYIEEIAEVFPPARLGPLGDPAKVNCGTCHRGEPQPLGGYELMHDYVVGLSEDGKVPDPEPKQAVLLGTAVPVAQTGNASDAPRPSAAPVDETAIERSVAPANEQGSGSGDGVRYESRTEPTGDGSNPAIGEATQARPDEGNDSPPGERPTGAEAPQGAAPDVLRPGTPMVREPEGSGGERSGGDPTAGTGPAPREDSDVAPREQPPVDEGSTGVQEPGQDTEATDTPSASEGIATQGVGNDAVGASRGETEGGQTPQRPTIRIAPPAN